jgi:hypothetical protein
VIPPNGDQPFQFVAVFQEIVNRLIGAFAGDDGYFGVGGLSCLSHVESLLNEKKSITVGPASQLHRENPGQLKSSWD